MEDHVKKLQKAAEDYQRAFDFYYEKHKRERNEMFREKKEYKVRLERFNNAIEYYQNAQGWDGAEELMLAAYSLSKIIKTFMHITTETKMPNVTLGDAMADAIKATKNGGGVIQALQIEANKLDTLSRVLYDVTRNKSTTRG